MTVLKIIGVLAAALLLLFFIAKVNNYTEKVYRFEFFNWTNYIVTSIGYAMMFFGYSWYTDALTQHGDLLNGEILFAIGIALVLFVIYYNIKHTSPFIGGVLTLVQLILYVGLAFIGFIVLLMVFAYFSETKPVYNVN